MNKFENKSFLNHKIFKSCDSKSNKIQILFSNLIIKTYYYREN
jgi:hypothetical protein